MRSYRSRNAWFVFNLIVGVLVLLTSVACSVTPDVQANRTLLNSSSNLSWGSATREPFELAKRASNAYENRNWFDAVRHYHALTEKIPDDAYSWFRLANSYVHQGDYDGAVKYYQQSLALDSAQAKTWFNLSTALLLRAKAALESSRHSLAQSDPAAALLDERLAALELLLK